MVLNQDSPWLRRDIPDLAYGTSAQIPDLAYGTSAAKTHRPGGGSLDALPLASRTKRPGGGVRTAESSEAMPLGPLYTRSPISALIELGTEWRPRARSHAIVSADLHRRDSTKHISQRSSTGFFKNGDWMMICCSNASCE